MVPDLKTLSKVRIPLTGTVTAHIVHPCVPLVRVKVVSPDGAMLSKSILWVSGAKLGDIYGETFVPAWA
eukprot:7188770-Pyramimonas_sp.AAC.1